MRKMPWLLVCQKRHVRYGNCEWLWMLTPNVDRSERNQVLVAPQVSEGHPMAAIT